MLKDVRRQLSQARRRTVHRVDHGHRLLDLLAFHLIEADGRLVGGQVELFFGDFAGQFHGDQSWLEIHRDGCPVVHCPGEVVGVDHVTEHVDGVAVGERDGGAGERDEGGVGQCFTNASSETVEVVVVAAMRFVDDHDDVAAVAQQWVVEARLALIIGQSELLQGGEVDAAGLPICEFGAQVCALRDANGRLCQQPRAIEALEQLGVQLVAVGDNHQRGVLQLGLLCNEVGVELHLHRLARALGVPHHPGLAVGFGGRHCGPDGLGDREVLVRLGDSFDEPVTARVERHEVALQLQEPFGVAHAVDQVLQFDTQVEVVRIAGEGRAPAVVVDVPGRVVVQRRERRSVAGGDAVADDGEHGEPERHRKLTQVGVQLGMGGRQPGRLRRCSLEFDEHHGQAVEVQHHVEAALHLARPNGQLADRQPVVVVDPRADQVNGRVVFHA